MHPRRPSRPLAVPPASRRLLPLALLPLGLLGSCDALGRRADPELDEQRAGGGESPPGRGYDVQHYAIELALDPAERRIEAHCKLRMEATVEGLEEVELDLSGLTVRSVRDERGNELSHAREGDALRIALADVEFPGQPFQLEIAYDGEPSTGLWFSGRRADGSGPSQVFTQGQPEHSRGWFPCNDSPAERATSEVRVTMPSGWVSFGPGQRVESLEGDGTRTEHWQLDVEHPTYLISLTAGEFVVEQGEWNGIPLTFAAEARYADWMSAAFDQTDEVLSFVADYVGVRYPYPKYSQVAVDNFMWGGMENASATTLTALTLDDERGNRDESSHDLVAHEVAHQWFGDLLTCRDWSHLWLNEGFATYMTLLYSEHSLGPDEFRARMRDVRDEYVREDRGAGRRPIVCAQYEDPEDVLDAHVYGGGAVRLHYLRFVLGDDLFRAGVRTYAAENQGRSVVTDDVRRAFEKVSGQDLGWFFEPWFGARGYPELTVAWSWDEKRRAVRLDVRQMQARGDGTPAVFRLPVDVEIHDQSGYAMHRIVIDERREDFELPTSGRPYYVCFDEGGFLPAAITENKPAAEWLALATSNDDVNARRDALTSLGRLAAEAFKTNSLHAHETYVAEIANLLKRDESPYVRKAAAEALGVAGGLEARERLMIAAREDQAASVRVAALNALASWDANVELLAFADEVFEQGYSWETMGAAAGLRCRAAPERAYSWLTEKLFIDSPHDQLCALLLAHLGGLSGPNVNDQLLRWARDEAVDPTARAVALKQLSMQTLYKGKNARTIAAFLDHENHRLRRAAVEALAAVGDSGSRQALAAHYPRATAVERRVIEASIGRAGR